MFDGNLGQQQAAAAVPADEEAVAADFNFFGLNWSRGGKDAQLNFQMKSLFDGNRREAIVVESRSARGFRHSPIDRAIGRHITDAAAQLFSALTVSFSRQILSRQRVAQVERSEYAAGLGKMRSRGLQGNLVMLEGGRDGVVREPKQPNALCVGEFLNGNHCRGRIML